MSRPALHSRQRGAIAILTAAFIVAAVALLTFAVDTGRLYAAQRKLAASANLAAIEAARQASGCRRDLGSSDGAAAARASLAANYAQRAGEDIPVVTRYDEGFVGVDDDLGLYTLSTRGTGRPDGVRLQVVDRGYEPLFGLFDNGDITLTAAAGARSQPRAALRYGTTLARIDPALLGDLLGTDIELASAGDLAETRVNLGDLLGIDLGVIEPEDLLDVRIATALGNVSARLDGLGRGVIAAVLDQLGDQPLSAVLSLAGPVGRDASISLGNLINTVAQLIAADRDTPIALDLALPTLPVNLGGVAVSLALLEPARTVIGPAGTNASGRYYTRVESAQVALGLDLRLALDVGGVALAEVVLPVSLRVASGEARLERIDCASAQQPFYTVTVSADSAAAEAAIGSPTPAGDIATGERAAIRIAGITVAEIFNRANQRSTLLARTNQRVVFDDIDDLARLPLTHDGDTTLRSADIAALVDNIQLDYVILPEAPVLGEIATGLTRAVLATAIDGLGDTLTVLTATTLAPILDPLLDSLGVSLAAPSLSLTELEPGTPVLFCASATDCGF
ncbi:hypothetical protein S4A8_15519 [Salinisphaera sp. S4-8]|uniref:pilus assembly protein TadG-related protein n=1 Tax=Salinisphaera sp. S4-8 TaxID=633357 RepID=UPI00334151AD